MPASSVAVRSLVLAVLGLGAASAMAQSPNVTAFNPYNGVGMSPGQGPMVVPQAGPPATGMAFNPWRPAGVTAGVGAGAPPPAPAYTTYNPGSNLPPPPPGPIQSHLLAIPQRGDAPGSRGRSVSATPPPAPASAPVVSAPPPPPAPPIQTAAPTPKPAPEPVPVKRPPVEAAAKPAPPPPAPTPAPPTPRPEPAAMATLLFSSQSAEISGEARAELERVAKAASSMRQIELRAYAAGPDPADARKVALARALAVRSYLIDLGVKSRIEVGAFSAVGRSGASERVDVIAPGT